MLAFQLKVVFGNLGADLYGMMLSPGVMQEVLTLVVLILFKIVKLLDFKSKMVGA